METINDIVRDIREHDGMCVSPLFAYDEDGGVLLTELADRIESAHKREIGELKGERKGILRANEAFASDNTRLRGELAEKDAEIERLKEYIAENDINGDTAVACLTEIKEAVEEKMAEIERLRALVKELANAASENMKSQCFHCDLKYACHEGEDGIVVPCSQVINLREALKKAREEVKDGK